MSKEKPKQRKRKRSTIAKTADKHIYYEKAVQSVEAEIDFIDQIFRKLRGRRACKLREDFCGTTNASCEWVRRRRTNIAYCVDIDPSVLDWGRRHHITRLTRHQASRIHLINDDVFRAKTPRVDVVAAMNFSYWFLKTRVDLRRYFRKAYSNLSADGILFIDAFGGSEAFMEIKERTRHRDFTYIWDQSRYNPITGAALMHIHFQFKDGSIMKKAFTYDWRLWTLPELTEILQEAGFQPTVYWEGEDRNGKGNGIFTPTTEGTADAGWIAYIVAEKR